ncbi:MAG: coproporphyrinogen dehydrogenase HemZ [Clostridiales bacterium]|jgi:oxygen-independent coproporphyrinogen-3 oxidase|nr:coproporphyrinogen dehydrogenase HemZ [Clostridiales bacterium]
MFEVILKGHDKYYGVSDVVRMFFGVPEELKDEGKVVAPEGPDIRITNELLPDGRSVTYSEDKVYEFEGGLLEPGREIKRSLYLALSDITSQRMPWGCLTGIRPTLVACEEEDAKALEDKYFVRPDKAKLAFETSREEQRILSLVPEESLCIYVGIPFCPSRCEYCSFISSDISCHMDRLVNYEAALEREISLIASSIKRPVSAVYVGGGTPTVFEEKEFASLLDCMFLNLNITPECEVTVEAGRPDTITDGKLLAMKDHGITRICINPQTMRSETLLKLGRKHTAEDIVRVYRKAEDTGFDLINMDLIAGLPYENADEHVKSTKRLIELSPANITVHTLYKKRRASISREQVMDLYKTRGELDNCVAESYDLLKEAGYRPYYMYRQKDTGHGLENTGFAKGNTGSLYNVAMMSDARDVLSFGAGGMSKRCFKQEGEKHKHRVERCPTIKDALTYIERVEEMAEKKIAFFGM